MSDKSRIDEFIHTLAALRDEERAREEARRRRVIKAHVNRFFQKFSNDLGADRASQHLADWPQHTKLGG